MSGNFTDHVRQESTVTYEKGAGRGEPTGEVACPVKGTIAKMRCWELQPIMGCAFTCPLAVKAQEIRALRTAMEHTREPERYDSDVDSVRCGRCNRVKSDPTMTLCATCRSELQEEKRKRRRGASPVPKYGRCSDCRREKPRTKSRRCAKCAANKLKRGRR